MELRRFDRRSIKRLRQALIDGEPVHWAPEGPVPEGLRVDELAPLLTTVRTSDERLRAAVEARMAPAAAPDAPTDLVTVVVPTHRRVPLGLAALRAQDVRPRILVLVNGDDGPERIDGAERLVVPWQGHGRTRQAALAHVRTPYVFFTVDDAVPLGRGFLRLLVESLQDAPRWEAMVARQLPWPGADHVTAERLRRWTPSGERVVAAPQADDVATLYRTDVLRRHPLPDVPIAEDAWWSRGRHVGYQPRAVVVHSHRRTPRALYQRTRAMHAELTAMGHAPAVPSLLALARALPGVTRPVAKGGPVELLNQVAELVGQYRGARDGADG
ncbi:MAG: hypothetical protein H6742_19305 [Alphaproteobacteria bacterium]|nr:hypothetical protein [Alphaproteobacteria bacterium]